MQVPMQVNRTYKARSPGTGDEGTQLSKPSLHPGNKRFLIGEVTSCNLSSGAKHNPHHMDHYISLMSFLFGGSMLLITLRAGILCISRSPHQWPWRNPPHSSIDELHHNLCTLPGTYAWWRHSWGLHFSPPGRCMTASLSTPSLPCFGLDQTHLGST